MWTAWANAAEGGSLIPLLKSIREITGEPRPQSAGRARPATPPEHRQPPPAAGISIAIRSAASCARSRLSATTSATGSPTWRTRPRARSIARRYDHRIDRGHLGRYKGEDRCPRHADRLSVNTPRTPGVARAAKVSIRSIVAWACGDRKHIGVGFPGHSDIFNISAASRSENLKSSNRRHRTRDIVLCSSCPLRLRWFENYQSARSRQGRSMAGSGEDAVSSAALAREGPGFRPAFLKSTAARIAGKVTRHCYGRRRPIAEARPPPEASGNECMTIAATLFHRRPIAAAGMPRFWALITGCHRRGVMLVLGPIGWACRVVAFPVRVPDIDAVGGLFGHRRR